MSVRKQIRLSREQKIAFAKIQKDGKWGISVTSEPYRIGREEFVQVTEGNRKMAYKWLDGRWKSYASAH